MFISSCLCVVTTYRHHKHADTTTPQCDIQTVPPWWATGRQQTPRELRGRTWIPSSPLSPAGVKSGPSRTWSFTGPLSITDACSAARNGDRAGSSRMTATCLCITAAVCSYSRAITSGLSARMKSCHYVECNVLSVRPGEQSKSISAVLTLNQIPKKDRTEWGICFVQWSKHGCSWTHTYTSTG